MPDSRNKDNAYRRTHTNTHTLVSGYSTLGFEDKVKYIPCALFTTTSIPKDD